MLVDPAGGKNAVIRIIVIDAAVTQYALTHHFGQCGVSQGCFGGMAGYVFNQVTV